MRVARRACTVRHGKAQWQQRHLGSRRRQPRCRSAGTCSARTVAMAPTTRRNRSSTSSSASSALAGARAAPTALVPRCVAERLSRCTGGSTRGGSRSRTIRSTPWWGRAVDGRADTGGLRVRRQWKPASESPRCEARSGGQRTAAGLVDDCSPGQRRPRAWSTARGRATSGLPLLTHSRTKPTALSSRRSRSRRGSAAGSEALDPDVRRRHPGLNQQLRG